MLAIATGRSRTKVALSFGRGGNEAAATPYTVQAFAMQPRGDAQVVTLSGFRHPRRSTSSAQEGEFRRPPLREAQAAPVCPLMRGSFPTRPCSSVVEQHFCKVLVAGSNPAGGLVHY